MVSVPRQLREMPMFEPNPQHLTKESFDKAYNSVPPWEIGRPQPEMLQLLDQGQITGAILDVGCGTGELALEMARRGLIVVGFDSSSKAIARAKQKSIERNVPAEFFVADALSFDLGREFDTAIDCGLFHVFSNQDRAKYVHQLAKAVRIGGRLILICFSDREQRDGGPRRITQAELREAFHVGWEFEVLRAATFDSLIHAGGAAAWLAVIRRTAS